MTCSKIRTRDLFYDALYYFTSLRCLGVNVAFVNFCKCWTKVGWGEGVYSAFWSMIASLLREGVRIHAWRCICHAVCWALLSDNVGRSNGIVYLGATTTDVSVRKCFDALFVEKCCVCALHFKLSSFDHSVTAQRYSMFLFKRTLSLSLSQCGKKYLLYDKK